MGQPPSSLLFGRSCGNNRPIATTTEANANTVGQRDGTDVQPILFKAGSIAERVLARDLYVLPEHAMFVDGMLVPARRLVNGVSVLQIKGRDKIDYVHLEFDRNVVIPREGGPAEIAGSIRTTGARRLPNSARGAWRASRSRTRSPRPWRRALRI
jgi:hypothetical protein